MKISQTGLLISMALCFALVTSCQKEEKDNNPFAYTDEEFATLSAQLNLPREQASYFVSFPDHVGVGVLPPVIDAREATLGAVLFYDKSLSANNTIACASCHSPSHAFADNTAFSSGVNGVLTERNTPSLAASLNFQASLEKGVLLGWDGAATSLRKQIEGCLLNSDYMGATLPDLALELEAIDYYNILFQKAYLEEKIRDGRIVGALEAFLLSFTTGQSRFDISLSKEGLPFPSFADFSQLENTGKSLYINHCADCHGLDFIETGKTQANIGLDMIYADQGIGALSQNSAEAGVFKVPFLKNISMTAPYMHDGRFQSLQEVMDHYSEGIQAHGNLDDTWLEDGNPIRLNLTSEEKTALVVFLFTLQDTNFTTDERFQDPFK